MGVRPPVIPPMILPHATPVRVVDRATMMCEMTVPIRLPMMTGLRPMMSDMLPVITQPANNKKATRGGDDRERQRQRQ